MMRASGFILQRTDLRAPAPLQVQRGNSCSRRFRGQSHLLAEGKANGEPCAAVLSILRDDLAAMRFNELAGNGKSQAETTGTSARTAIKLLEHFLFFAGTQARTMIGNRNYEHGIIARRAHFDRFIAFPMRNRI